MGIRGGIASGEWNFARGAILVAVAASVLASTAQGAERAELWRHLRYREGTRLTSANPAYPFNGQPPREVACRVSPDMIPALRALLAAAFQAHHRLVAASCFRSVDAQVDIFFAPPGDPVPATPDEIAHNAYKSAPPGFSEHHTGYAIDFCDADTPETCASFDVNFAETAAGKWLVANGAHYGFEMSFPRATDPCVSAAGRVDQGVAYEPWHWRFAGTQAARQVFERARTRFAVCPKPAAEALPPNQVSETLDRARGACDVLWQSLIARLRRVSGGS
ncbi:MAG: M15 family metallopeptidase [Alphaproteobacteria bacterium]